MIQEFLSKTPLALWPTLAFLLFMATFLGVCIYLLVGVFQKKDFSHVASMPLDDDAPELPEKEG